MLRWFACCPQAVLNLLEEELEKLRRSPGAVLDDPHVGR